MLNRSFWGQGMSLAWGALEVVRELRWFWQPSNQCPWGAIAFASLLILLCGCALGACISACICSAGCRRAAVACLQFGLAQLHLEPVTLRDRLAEYHPRRA